MFGLAVFGGCWAGVGRDPAQHAANTQQTARTNTSQTKTKQGVCLSFFEVHRDAVTQQHEPGRANFRRRRERGRKAGCRAAQVGLSGVCLAHQPLNLFHSEGNTLMEVDCIVFPRPGVKKLMFN